MLEKHSIGFQEEDFIMDINSDKIHQLSREFFKDRSKKNPSLDDKDEDAMNQKLGHKMGQGTVLSEAERLKKSNCKI